MIPLDHILGDSPWVPDGTMYAQVIGEGWMLGPMGYWPFDPRADHWICYEINQHYERGLKEQRGY